MSNPLISVVLPTHNRGNMIDQVIMSVLNQTYEPIELLVVDDGSTDDTTQKVKDFENDSITYIKLDENKGPNFARNVGLNQADGNFISFIDSDVIILPEKLSKQLNVLLNADDKVGIVHCGHFRNYYGYLIPNRKYLSGHIFNDLIMGKEKVITSSMLIKRDCFDTAGQWDEELPSFNEFDLTLRFAKHFRFDVVPEPLFYEIDHVHHRITSDIAARREGIKRILEKWGDDMTNINGADSQDLFEREKLRDAYHKNARQHIRNNKRINAASAYWNYLRYEDELTNLLRKRNILLLLSFICGRRFYNTVMESYVKNKGESITIDNLMTRI